MPVSAGNERWSMRSSPYARRVISMLCAMYGCSRTSSFGLTMKLLTYQEITPTARYAVSAGRIAAISQRSRGADTALIAAIAAPSTSAADTISKPVSVTCASVYVTPEKMTRSSNSAAKRPRYTRSASVNSSAANASDSPRHPVPRLPPRRRPVSTRDPPVIMTKNTAIAHTMTASVMSQPAMSCHAGNVKR